MNYRANLFLMGFSAIALISSGCTPKRQDFGQIDTRDNPIIVIDPSEPTYDLEVQVRMIDHSTGLPIENVECSNLRIGVAYADQLDSRFEGSIKIQNQEGRVTLSGLPASRYRVAVAAGSYLGVSFTVDVGPDRAEPIVAVLAHSGDFNGDNVVNVLDLDVLNANFDTETSGCFAIPGNANGDKFVDVFDLDAMIVSFEMKGESLDADDPSSLGRPIQQSELRTSVPSKALSLVLTSTRDPKLQAF